MSDELKPCLLPACGGEAKEIHGVESWIACIKCGLSTKPKSVITQADRDAWNNRTPDPSLTRILKLAAACFFLHTGKFFDIKARTQFEEAKKALTPEDIARIKEISL